MPARSERRWRRPRLRSGPPDKPIRAQRKAPRAPKGFNNDGGTILVADDSATMRMIVQATLTGAGWKVVTAGNGQEALEMARSHPIDLVVSDWNMPVMGGLELIQGLRERTSTWTCPFSC